MATNPFDQNQPNVITLYDPDSDIAREEVYQLPEPDPPDFGVIREHPSMAEVHRHQELAASAFGPLGAAVGVGPYPDRTSVSGMASNGYLHIWYLSIEPGKFPFDINKLLKDIAAIHVTGRDDVTVSNLTYAYWENGQNNSPDSMTIANRSTAGSVWFRVVDLAPIIVQGGKPYMVLLDKLSAALAAPVVGV